MVRVRAATLDEAATLVAQFLESTAHGRGNLLAIRAFPTRSGGERRSFGPKGSAWLRRLADEHDAVAYAKAIRLETQLAPYRKALGVRRYRALEREYLERISFGRERRFLRDAIGGLPALELTASLRRDLYEIAVAHRQHTTPKTFPFADGSAHLESCRVFDLRGQGRRHYALCAIHPHSH